MRAESLAQEPSPSDPVFRLVFIYLVTSDNKDSDVGSLLSRTSPDACHPNYSSLDYTLRRVGIAQETLRCLGLRATRSQRPLNTETLVRVHRALHTCIA